MTHRASSEAIRSSRTLSRRTRASNKYGLSMPHTEMEHGAVSAFVVAHWETCLSSRSMPNSIRCLSSEKEDQTLRDGNSMKRLQRSTHGHSATLMDRHVSPFGSRALLSKSIQCAMTSSSMASCEEQTHGS